MIERYRTKVEVSLTGCWHWIGSKTHDGYGHLKLRGKTTYAHRVFYEELCGQIPSGCQLDHKCHTLDAACLDGRMCPHRACVNPDHLEPVDKFENDRRGRSAWGVNARKTHCVHGHAFTPENTYEWRGWRMCRACRSRYQRGRTRTRAVG